MLVGATVDPPPAVLPMPILPLPNATTTALLAATFTVKTPDCCAGDSICVGDQVPSAATELPPSVIAVFSVSEGAVSRSTEAVV